MEIEDRGRGGGGEERIARGKKSLNEGIEDRTGRYRKDPRARIEKGGGGRGRKNEVNVN